MAEPQTSSRDVNDGDGQKAESSHEEGLLSNGDLEAVDDPPTSDAVSDDEVLLLEGTPSAASSLPAGPQIAPALMSRTPVTSQSGDPRIQEHLSTKAGVSARGLPPTERQADEKQILHRAMSDGTSTPAQMAVNNAESSANKPELKQTIAEAVKNTPPHPMSAVMNANASNVAPDPAKPELESSVLGGQSNDSKGKSSVALVPRLDEVNSVVSKADVAYANMRGAAADAVPSMNPTPHSQGDKSNPTQLKQGTSIPTVTPSTDGSGMMMPEPDDDKSMGLTSAKEGAHDLGSRSDFGTSVSVRAIGDAATTRPEVGRTIATQIADTVARQADRPVEIALNPEELGRVRMILSTSDSGVTVMIAAERPETHDLIRRHIDLLAAELRRLGYDEIGFEFSGDGSGSSSTTGTDPADSSEFESETPDHQQPFQHTQRLTSSALDLRL